MSTELFNKCDVNHVLQCKLLELCIIFIFYLLYIFNEIASHHCLVPTYYMDFYILMYLYPHCTIV